MRRNPKYRDVSTTTLRAQLRVLDVPGVRWVWSQQVVDMRTELLFRELPVLAVETGGWLVAAPMGVE